MVSQLTAVTSDGRPSENAQEDCVPASIGAALLWYEGKSQWDTSINPDMLKDAAYGEAWRNDGTAASRYISICQQLGYHLYPVTGIPGALVTKAHEYLQAGVPVIFTEPDPYVSASLGWSHVCVFYAEEPGYLTALDPYIAKPVRRTDREWMELLQFNQIWILEKEDEVLSIDLNVPAVAAHFKQGANANAWVCLQTGKTVHDGMLTFYRTFGRSACCGLTWLGLPKSNEVQLGGGATRQSFECGVLIYDPNHTIDHRPGDNGPVYLAHLYEGVGQDPAIADLQKQLAALKAQPAATDPQAAAALALVKDLKTKVAAF